MRSWWDMDLNKYELDVDKISKITDIMLNKFEKDANQLTMPDLYLMATILVASETNK